MTNQQAAKQTALQLTCSKGFQHLYFTWHHANGCASEPVQQYAERFAKKAVNSEWPEAELPPPKDLFMCACMMAMEENMKLFNDFKVSPDF